MSFLTAPIFPQIVNMYIMYPEVAEVVHPYIVFRCRKSADFSLQCAWLLDAYTPTTVDSNVKRQRSHATKLKNLVNSLERVLQRVLVFLKLEEVN